MKKVPGLQYCNSLFGDFELKQFLSFDLGELQNCPAT